MIRTLLLIFALFNIAVSAKALEAKETVWLESENVVSCVPKELVIGDALQVKLGAQHGKELAIYRHSENIWLFLVVGSQPPDMVSIMSPLEFKAAKSLEIAHSTTGYRWDSKGGNEAIFSKPGKYTLYVSENLESEEGGYKCELIIKNR